MGKVAPGRTPATVPVGMETQELSITPGPGIMHTMDALLLVSQPRQGPASWAHPSCTCPPINRLVRYACPLCACCVPAACPLCMCCSPDTGVLGGQMEGSEGKSKGHVFFFPFAFVIPNKNLPCSLKKKKDPERDLTLLSPTLQL